MRRLRSIHGLMTLLGVLAITTGAQAQDIDAALQMEDEGLLVDALDAFEVLRTVPGNSRDELTTIYQHLSVLRFSAGDHSGARDAMMRLAAIAPEVTLPDSAPPEVQRAFERVTERWEERLLRAELELEGRRASRVRARVLDDLMDMVAAVEVVVDGRVIAATDQGGPSYELELPDDVLDEARAATVRLLDEHNGTLWEGELQLEDAGDDAPVVSDTSGAPRWHRAMGWALIGVGLAGVIGGGVSVGLDGTSTGEQRVVDGILEERFRSTAAGGWVLIGLGAAAALGGLIWLLLDREPAQPGAAEEEMATDPDGSW